MTDGGCDSSSSSGCDSAFSFFGDAGGGNYGGSPFQADRHDRPHRYPIFDVARTQPYQSPDLGYDVIVRPALETDFRVCTGRLAGESGTEWTIIEPKSGRIISLLKREWSRCERLAGRFAEDRAGLGDVRV